MKRVSSVYVAASSSEMARAKEWINRLRHAGLRVTSTWPEVIASVGSANPRDAADEDRHGWAFQDLTEIDQADLLWFLVPREANGRGAYFESGYARARDKVLILSGDTKQSVFAALGFEYEHDVDAFARICRIAREGLC